MPSLLKDISKIRSFKINGTSGDGEATYEEVDNPLYGKNVEVYVELAKTLFKTYGPKK